MKKCHINIILIAFRVVNIIEEHYNNSINSGAILDKINLK